MITWLMVLGVLAVVAVMVWKSRQQPEEEVSIPFGPSGAGALDFDRLETQYPLTAADLERLNPENIESFNQDQIDQIYARLSAGPIPDGPYQGSFFFAEGSQFRNIADLIGGIRGMGIDLKLDLLTKVGELFWQGKVFYRDKLELRNIIDKEQIISALFGVSRDEMRIEEVLGDKVALLFPAKLYTGESQFDPRRPSVIIDYAETAEVEGYIEKIDRLGGKDGLMIRDEIRMLRPGFYLGRAYFGTLFGLNFTLINGDVARSGNQDA
ncbi:MAG: hypothetical protein QNK22_04180 [Xanthomonadales bacterium]|nr:hypothetical protein [Xanthomonadales bacterium]